MDQQAFARQIAEEVVRSTQFWIAVVGLAGVITGAIITITGNVLLHWLQGRKGNALDGARQKLLKVLPGSPWVNRRGSVNAE